MNPHIFGVSLLAVALSVVGADAAAQTPASGNSSNPACALLKVDEIRKIKRLLPELIAEAVDKASLRGLQAFLERNLTYNLYQVLDEAKIALSSAPSATVAFASERRSAGNWSPFPCIVTPARFPSSDLMMIPGRPISSGASSA